MARRQSLGEQVVSSLKQAIMSGHFAPGEKLTIRAVAGALGVSLTPAREALFQLAAEGALEMRADRSVYVPELSTERIDEMTRIRMALEGLAAEQAATRLADDDVAALERINAELVARHAKRDFHRLIECNWRFHFRIYAAAGMPTLLRLIENCWLGTGSYIRLIYPSFGDADDGIDNHAAMLDAARRRHRKALRRAVEQDIAFASAAMRRAAESRAADSG